MGLRLWRAWHQGSLKQEILPPGIPSAPEVEKCTLETKHFFFPICHCVTNGVFTAQAFVYLGQLSDLEG